MPGSLELFVLIGIVAIAALCGFLTSNVMQRNKRRDRGFFVLGVLTGLLAGAVARRRVSRLSALGALTRGVVGAKPRTDRPWLRIAGLTHR